MTMTRECQNKEFEEFMKGVMGSLETAVEGSFQRLSKLHASSVEKHERLIKDAHDQLVEASGKFKEAAERQVDGKVQRSC
jgi:hypothetical protein